MGSSIDFEGFSIPPSAYATGSGAASPSACRHHGLKPLPISRVVPHGSGAAAAAADGYAAPEDQLTLRSSTALLGPAACYKYAFVSV